jgi:leader peptidase (prepilin peptidase)/N-methyltransferase
MDTLNFIADTPAVFLAIVAFMSLFIGSFLNVVVHRLPRMMEREWSEECRVYLGLKPHNEPDKLSLCLPASHCPHCKHAIRPWHNIPVLSYVFLMGKCAFCKARISPRYPLVELITCLMSVYVAWRFGYSWQTLTALLFTWSCIALTFIDIDHHLLPDQLTLSLLWLGLFASLFNVFISSQDAIIGAMTGYILFATIQGIFGYATGKTGIGQGDYKLLAAFGAFVGWKLLPLIVMIASVCGITFTLIQMIIQRSFKSVPLPFGPYLAVAAWIALLWGNDMMQYYLSIF